MNIRNCPTCNILIQYNSIYAYKIALRKNTICRSCNGKRISLNNKLTGKLSGKNHPLYGKKHSQNTKEKISKHHANVSGSKNPMYKKTIFQCWSKKYDNDTVIKKIKQYKQKLSEMSTGDQNNMFGKPSPVGSGNGWSGWYNNWYFRSLLELSYMIKVIERFKISWESAEKREYAISYKDKNGNMRTYFPDFVLSKKYVIECKPVKLQSTDEVKRKKMAAIALYGDKKLIYKIRCVKLLSYHRLKQLIEDGKVTLTRKYQDRFKQLYYI